VRCKGARTKKTDLNLPEEWTFPSQFETCPPVRLSGDNHGRCRRHGRHKSLVGSPLASKRHYKSESTAELLHSSDQSASTAHDQVKCETNGTSTKSDHNLAGSSVGAPACRRNPTASNDEERARMISGHTNELFVCIDDSPLVSKSDVSKAGTCIEQLEKEQYVHHTAFVNARDQIFEPPHAPLTSNSSTPTRNRKGSSLQAPARRRRRGRERPPHGSIFVWAREGSHDGAKEHPAYLLPSPPHDSPTCDEDEGRKSGHDSDHCNDDDSDDRSVEDCVWVKWASTGTIALIPRSNVVIRDDKRRKKCKGLKEISTIESNSPKKYHLGHLKPLFNG
jgi:hypothetical protein